MTQNVIFAGGPLDGKCEPFTRLLDAWEPPDHRDEGIYFKSGMYYGGMPVYEWVEA